jgi:hypothetical protein
MALKSIIEDVEMRREIDIFVSAYNQTLISDRQLTMPAIVVQSLVDIYYNNKKDLLGNDLRDLTPQGIAERAKEILADLDPETKVHPRLVTKLLREELGIVNIGKRHPLWPS